MKSRARPRVMQIAPTTMYAMPRKGFLPPSTEVVDRIMRLVPSNETTGYSAIAKDKDVRI